VKVVFAIMDGSGAGADSSSLDISIRPILHRDYSLPGRSDRQADELGRRSFPLDLHGRYVLHVRGSDLLSARLDEYRRGSAYSTKVGSGQTT
jgi:hypothetical protein